jgi:hypothetical protein
MTASSTVSVQIMGQTLGYDNGSSNWRVDNNRFEYTGLHNNSSNSGVGVNSGYTYGLIDNNRFDYQGRAIFIRGGSDSSGEACYGDDGWDTTKQGAIDWGGPKAVYIEHNWYYGTEDNSQFLDSNFGVRIVTRFNYIQNGSIMAHSGCGSGTYAGGGAVHQEIYGNTFVLVPGAVSWYGMLIRSGTFVIYDNTFTGAFGMPLTIDYPGGEGCELCTAPRYPKPCYTSMCYSQIGAGPDTTHSGLTSVPAYFWSNYFNSSLKAPEKGICGQAATRLGIDYINNGTTPKPGYTAYTYPHPLRNQSILRSSSTTDAPGAPTGLKIVK